jgi:hypothetical protein
MGTLKVELPSNEQGLPDGKFSYRKSLFGYMFEGLGIEDVIFYGH